MMEKEPQPDSITTVTIKPEYPPSEVYSSEPPPAYHRPQSSAVQVAKIVAVTVVLVSVVLGSFLLASAYVTANASCRQLERELELLSEAADHFQSAGPLQPEALVQDQTQAQSENHKSQVDPKKMNDIDNNSIDNGDSSSDSSSSESDDEEDKTPIKFKLPLQLDFDDLAGALIEKNQKSRMNCIVEKKRAEEVVDHQPKTLRLPYGINLTTDPRYEHVSGERMAIFCESGNFQSKPQPQNNESDNDDSDEEQTIMIQPVMMAIPQTRFQTHMAQQMPPMVQQQPLQPQSYPQIHPMETMRPPMPPQAPQNHLPPTSVLHHIAQQLIAQKIMERVREEQQNQEAQQQEQNEPRQIPQRFISEGMISQRLPPLPEEILSQLNRLPNRNVIVAVSEQDSDENSQENIAPQQEIRVVPQELHVVPQEVRVVHQEMRVSAPQDMGEQQQQQPQQQQQQPEQLRIIQNQRQSAAEMNGRQSYARGLPVHIPVHMIQQEQQEPETAASEQSRPHYLHPRSLRSVDALLPKSQKRVKRCSCDCAC